MAARVRLREGGFWKLGDSQKLKRAVAEKFGGTELGLYKDVKFFGMGSLGRPTTSDIFQLLKQVAPAVELTDAAGALLNDFFVALTRAFTAKGTQDADVLGAIDELVPDSTWLQEAAQTGQLTTLGDDETEHMINEEIRAWPSDTLLRAVETAMVEVLSTASEEATEEQRTTVGGSHPWPNLRPEAARGRAHRATPRFRPGVGPDPPVTSGRPSRGVRDLGSDVGVPDSPGLEQRCAS